jgi:predicted ABC-type ATPase
MKKRGYKIHIFYLWVKSVELSVSRVQERVSRSGHHVPEEVIRRRFDRSIRNFMVEYRRMADSWYFFNNSDPVMRRVSYHSPWRLGQSFAGPKHQSNRSMQFIRLVNEGDRRI